MRCLNNKEIAAIHLSLLHAITWFKAESDLYLDNFTLKLSKKRSQINPNENNNSMN
jgi:hypothetical protein